MATRDKPPEPPERDERLTIPLDPEEALRALLKVDAHAPTSDDEPPRARDKDTR
jgi:hypothetical protein